MPLFDVQDRRPRNRHGGQPRSEHPRRTLPGHDGIRTDAEGAYLLTGRDHWSADSLRFSDTDGEANGGRFVRRAVGIDWQKAVQTGKGDGGWYRGEYSLTVDAELEKEPDDQTS